MPIDHLPPQACPVDPRLERGLRLLVLIGLAAVLLLPAARGSSAWLGWMPLWLVGMPLAGWWALHRFRLPRRALVPLDASRRRRGRRAQARRRGPQRLSKVFAHAA